MLQVNVVGRNTSSLHDLAFCALLTPPSMGFRQKCGKNCKFVCQAFGVASLASVRFEKLLGNGLPDILKRFSK